MTTITIVGFRFQDPPVTSHAVFNSEQVLNLKREPENEYDSNAIAVYMGYRKVGYLSKYDQECVQEYIDDSQGYVLKRTQQYEQSVILTICRGNEITASQ